MGNVSGLAAAAQGVSALSSAANGYSQYQSQLGQAKWQSQAYNQNAQIALMQGAVAGTNAERAAMIRGQQAAQVVGKQRAIIGNGAANVNTGSAAQVQVDTGAAAVRDEQQIMNNAALQAWGYQTEASNYESQAQMAKIAGRFNANSSLISGGLGFARGVVGGAYYGKQAGWFDTTQEEAAAYSKNKPKPEDLYRRDISGNYLGGGWSISQGR
jgi:hypothetical protein